MVVLRLGSYSKRFCKPDSAGKRVTCAVWLKSQGWKTLSP
jgi:hypothetical protein